MKSKDAYARRKAKYLSQTPSPALCPHEECKRCSAQSVSPEVSDQYICCKCYDLHPRPAVKDIDQVTDDRGDYGQ